MIISPNPDVLAIEEGEAVGFRAYVALQPWDDNPNFSIIDAQDIASKYFPAATVIQGMGYWTETPGSSTDLDSVVVIEWFNAGGLYGGESLYPQEIIPIIVKMGAEFAKYFSQTSIFVALNMGDEVVLFSISEEDY